MSKILKNTTLSDIELGASGLFIPASGQITIDEQDYLLLSSEDSIAELSPLINAGDIVVNDGNIDLFASKAIQYVKYPDNYISGHTVYVSPGGSNSTGDGSANNPYADLTGVKTNLDNGNITTPSTSVPLTIEMDAGSYSQAPVDFSAYNNYNIIGKALRTRINASNPNADLLTMGIDSGIRSVSLAGVTNANNWHVVVTATNGGGFSSNDLTLLFGSNGIKFVNTSGTITASLFTTLSLGITGTIAQSNDNVIMTMTGYNAIGNGTTTVAVEQNGSGILFLNTARLSTMGTGIKTNGSGTTELIGVTQLGAAAVLEQNGTGIIKVLGGNFDITSSTVSDTSKLEGYFLNELPGETQLRVLSELSVGLPNKGKESSFGEGDAYTLGQLVYTETSGGAFTNVSDEAGSLTLSTFTFPGTAVDNAIYVSTAFDTTTPLRFFGIQIDTLTAANLGASGDIVFEYWNGSTWTEFNHMIVDSLVPHKPYANSKFEQTGKYEVHFDTRLETLWQTNDPVSLGINLHWIRVRVANASITTAPVFEQFKIHTNKLKIEEQGFKTMYGLARTKEKFPITIGGLQESDIDKPGDADVYVSSKLGIKSKRNRLEKDKDHSIVFNQFLPFEIDTSSPMDLTFSYFVEDTQSGDIRFVIRWATTDPESPVYNSSGDSPPTAPNERSVAVIETFNAADRRTDRTVQIRLEIPEALSQGVDGNPSDKIWISLERNSKNAADTLNANVNLVDFAIYYTAWRNGGYSGEFT